VALRRHAGINAREFITASEVCLEIAATRGTSHRSFVLLAGGLLDTPLLYQYKNAMRRSVRIIVCLGLQVMLTGCSLFARGTPTSPSSTIPAGPAISLTDTPVPTPTETPIPIVRVGSADKALLNGDVDTAMLQYRAAATDSTDPNVREAALWGLARAQYEDERYADAAATLDQLIKDYPASSYRGPAGFLKGESLYAMQHYSDAAAAFQDYLASRPGVLDSYVGELRGDALSQAGDYSGALSTYVLAQAAPHLDDAQALQIKIAQTNAQLGDYGTAIAMYDGIAANTTNDYTRAEMDYLAGESYVGEKQNAEAYVRFQHAVENYPLSTYSYLGLVELINAGVSVSDLDRGLTDYYAGIYDKALESLDRYISANSANAGTAHFYRALCLEKQDKPQDAINELDYYIEDYPTGARWADAWDEKSSIQQDDLNLYPQAAQTLLDYVKAAPNTAHAPEALMTAARILESDGRLDQAAATWQQVVDQYPSYSLASTAVFFSGLMQYRQADYNAALPLLERSLVAAAVPEDQARAYLWIGKTQQKLNRQTETQNAWQLAQSADPRGYYGERANDLLQGRQPFTPPASTNLQIDLSNDRKAADAWMRLTFKLPADTDLSGPGTLASDPRFIRGREFWNLGWFDASRLEFEDLRTSISDDAVQTYRLGNYLLDLGMYRSAILALRQVLSLAGLQDQSSTMLAPPYFTHVRYGLYYSDLIVPAAQANNLDPLFLFSVIRQESLFEGFVSSTAGARGLMQIVPATGGGIARALGWPINYGPDQLYRPNVSIMFGAYYMSSNRTNLGGDLYAALAAYNGGPTVASDAAQLAHGDPDLLLEAVRIQETRDYIRSVYENYVIYSRLYGPGS
jgi:soluble lytic murein transglycosylase